MLPLADECLRHQWLTTKHSFNSVLDANHRSKEKKKGLHGPRKDTTTRAVACAVYKHFMISSFPSLQTRDAAGLDVIDHSGFCVINVRSFISEASDPVAHGSRRPGTAILINMAHCKSVVCPAGLSLLPHNMFPWPSSGICSARSGPSSVTRESTSRNDRNTACYGNGLV